MSTLQELENKWAVMMAATNPKTGQRVTEYDLKYARECHALRVQIEEQKRAEASRPQISTTQLDQLAWLDRLQGARDQSGKRLHDEFGGKFRQWVDTARRAVQAGNLISPAVIAKTEAQYAEQNVTIPAAVHAPQPSALARKLQSEGGAPRPLPPASYNPREFAQVTQSTMGKK